MYLHSHIRFQTDNFSIFSILRELLYRITVPLIYMTSNVNERNIDVDVGKMYNLLIV